MKTEGKHINVHKSSRKKTKQQEKCMNKTQNSKIKHQNKTGHESMRNA